MAKQPEDNRTMDLLEQPKRRGRPPTGKALSGAERQARHRVRREVRADNVESDARDVVALWALLDASERALLPRNFVKALDRLGSTLGLQDTNNQV